VAAGAPDGIIPGAAAIGAAPGGAIAGAPDCGDPGGGGAALTAISPARGAAPPGGALVSGVRQLGHPMIWPGTGVTATSVPQPGH